MFKMIPDDHIINHLEAGWSYAETDLFPFQFPRLVFPHPILWFLVLRKDFLWNNDLFKHTVLIRNHCLFSSPLHIVTHNFNHCMAWVVLLIPAHLICRNSFRTLFPHLAQMSTFTLGWKSIWQLLLLSSYFVTSWQKVKNLTNQVIKGWKFCYLSQNCPEQTGQSNPQ